MGASFSAAFLLQLEFDVNMTCGSCEVKVRESLEKVGVYDPQIDVQKQTVVVDTDVPFSKVQEAIQSTGRKAVLKGYGSSTGLNRIRSNGAFMRQKISDRLSCKTNCTDATVSFTQSGGMLKLILSE